ncbi:MAG TPA: spore coat U domain-containing protein [Burkholderiaceae bacterium]|nr:spore coat U domain-containing protein [Burkholderiaceae bacterium]
MKPVRARALRHMGEAIIALVFASMCAGAQAQLISCGFSGGVNALSFGSYTGFSSASATTQIRVSCLGAAVFVPIQLKLSAGNAFGYSPRRLSGGGNTLAYNLYLDAANTRVWGDGTGGTEYLSQSIVISLGTQTFTVYGFIPAGQSPPPGTYTATITATLTF